MPFIIYEQDTLFTDTRHLKNALTGRSIEGLDEKYMNFNQIEPKSKLYINIYKKKCKGANKNCIGKNVIKSI